MSARILTFPQGDARPPISPVRLANIGSPDVRSQLATKFADRYLPIVQVSLELIEADEQDFEARCRQMLDVEGGAMIDELCGELQIVRRQMQLLADGLEVARARVRTAMSRLAPIDGRGAGDLAGFKLTLPSGTQTR